MVTSARLVALSGKLPVVAAPFVVLVDADEDDWGDPSWARRLGRELLVAGCRYFVCFGQRSEFVHDIFDDVIVAKGYDGVCTTFHVAESKQEVLDFLLDCASIDMKEALVLVCDTSGWERALRLRAN